MSADGDMPVRSCHDKNSAGVESKSQVRMKKAVLKRNLVPLCVDCGLEDPPVPVLIEAAL